MSEKKSFIIRINQEVYTALEKWATDEFRSVNGQIEYLLTNALKSSGRIKKNKNNEKGKDH
ncbi:MAG TPA: Arc family DNA-binding protein [Bacteroidales bacterium]|nr:Arc family DNA-binding protein [Bacteroidales bacterium]HQH18321.1 Arc family DNA-binding protein [Bacteroidales bacterium]HQI45079.1 Arc family DNA-binding protein [Bacteroidales bacterium]